MPVSPILDAVNFCDYTLPPRTTVFTSEDYGAPYCRFLRCEHRLVDRERVSVPTSGTAVRGSAVQQWQYISKPVSNAACCMILLV